MGQKGPLENIDSNTPVRPGPYNLVQVTQGCIIQPELPQIQKENSSMFHSNVPAHK